MSPSLYAYVPMGEDRFIFRGNNYCSLTARGNQPTQLCFATADVPLCCSNDGTLVRECGFVFQDTDKQINQPG